MNKYSYKVKVLLECENIRCDYSYVREDEFANSDKMKKKDMLNFYDTLYEGELEEDMPHCPFCDSFLIETKIVNYEEIYEKKRYYDLNVAVDKNDNLIIENNMRVLGITLEGTNEDGKYEMLNLPLNEDNYIKIYNKAKEYWDKGNVSKYLICFMNSQDICFQYTRPDKYNFKKMIPFEILCNKESLNEISKYYNKDFILSKTTELLKKKYNIEIVKKEILNNEKEKELC